MACSQVRDTAYTSILEGYLTKSPPFEHRLWFEKSRKKWRRRYFVLYGDVNEYEASLLAYYENKEAFASNQCYKALINLNDCTNICKRTELYGRQDVISLATSQTSVFKGRVFHLAPDSDDGSREYQVKWVEEIEKRLFKLGSRNSSGSSGYVSCPRSSVGSRTSTRSRVSFNSMRSRISSWSSRGSNGSRSDYCQPFTEQEPVEHVNRPDAAENNDNCIPVEVTEDANESDFSIT